MRLFQNKRDLALDIFQPDTDCLPSVEISSVHESFLSVKLKMDNAY